MSEKLDREYYAQFSTIELAKNLLGKILMHRTEDGLVSGMIVETEAYLQDDPACHAFIGKTLRNKSVFESPGTSYVYLIYGSYFCFNVVGNKKGIGEAVLIRALEPLQGINVMRNRFKFRRKNSNTDYSLITNLTNGPGKLCIALDITRRHDGVELYKDNDLYIENNSDISEKNIITTTRVGLTKAKDLPFRFYISDSKYVSRK